MKITNVEVFKTRVAPIGEFCAWGWSSTNIKITTDEGIVGWGEADSNGALIETLVNMPNSNFISYGLKELLIGENPLDIERLWYKMYYKTLHHGRDAAAIHAISAIDIALWDIAGKYYNVPVYQLLGGKYRNYIDAYGTFVPSDDHEETAEIAKNAVKDGGYKLLKYGGGSFGTSEKFDVDSAKAVREAVGDDIGIAIDVCKQWKSYSTALSRARKLEQFNLEWIEEPVAPGDYDSYRRLGDKIQIKISGGEAITTVQEVAKFMKETRVDIVQPDVTNCGGITEIKKIEMIAKLYGCKLIPHGFGTGILFAATIHSLASSEYGDLMEYSISESPLFKYVDRKRAIAVDGRIEVPDRVGLGVDIDEDVLKEYSYTY
ncbi:mandelate racemase/muconate lactonizing enzyme family protein [Abyssisolibacter fermentans]|uniref:mandelate racemase/muconate lactonizing enzyme family protein n=1 Tax=Abyssisolibacter fermentans TaxID=1766203 RepID=UPI00083596B2|nr:mandelate racemase/muconate lactonizing enzyme family protein [Abyssisolibacter fermentans]